MGQGVKRKDLSVTRKSKSSQATGLKETQETYDPTFPSVSSTFTDIPGSSMNKRADHPVAFPGKVRKGY